MSLVLDLYLTCLWLKSSEALRWRLVEESTSAVVTLVTHLWLNCADACASAVIQRMGRPVIGAWTKPLPYPQVSPEA